jgi:predicted ArsR family transcriptional regulator
MTRKVKPASERWSDLATRQSAKKGHARSARGSLTVVYRTVTRLAPVTARDIATATGLAPQTVHRALMRLLSDGRIQYIHPGKGDAPRWYFPHD